MSNKQKQAATALLCKVDTPEGTLEFWLTRKRVKNLNLRVQGDGRVLASAPPLMPRRHIDEFVRQKAAWIQKTQQRLLAKPPAAPPLYTKEECLALFEKISAQLFPLFADVLGGQAPLIKVREMKSRWGVCHIQKRSITLNTRLAEKPLPAIEYVLLHEYVHFIHPDHQAGFHAEMARLMPDYLQRRRLLRG